MATQAHTWNLHNGKGCPVPKGTLIDVRHFNGDVSIGVRVGSICVDMDGTPINQTRARWSGWHYDDGGPMAPKFKAYRLNEIHQRNAEMFSSWLDVREREAA